MRRLLFACVLLSGCTERERPDPFAPNTPALLSAEVVAPRTGQTTQPGSLLPVRVRATERGLRLTGIGYVAYRFNAARLDSVVITFPARADTTHDFTLRVPTNLPPNTQIDLVGFGLSGTAAVRSVTQSVVVVAR